MDSDYRAIFDAAGEMIFVNDPSTGRFLDANRSACEMLGYTKEEILEFSVGDLSAGGPTYTQEQVLPRIIKAQQEGPQLFEWLCKDRSGRLFPVEVHLKTARMADGERVLAVVRDISERKQAEEALRQSEAQYRTTIDSLGDAVHVIDPDFRILLANARFKQWLGELDLDQEPVGKTVFEAFPFLPERVQREYQSVFRSGGTLVTEECIELDGRTVTTETRKIPVFEDGKVVRVITVIRDITERRRLEQEIIRISEHERQRIAQDLHDDLGQQICGIGLIARALEQKLRQQSLSESDDAAKVCELLNTAATTTRELARGLLPVEVESGGLAAALENLAGKVEQLLDIPCRFSATQTILVSDHLVAGHLFRIAQEAISNALRHGSPEHVEVRMEQADDTLTLNIEDDGVGVPDAPDGTQGLGIRLMRHRASLIGASLTIRPNTPTGTVVTCAVGFSKEQAP